MTDNILDEEDEELLANFLMDDDDDDNDNLLLASFPTGDEADCDSADEVLAMLMEKENGCSPLKKKQKPSVACYEVEEEDVDENDEGGDETAAEIAALQAQIEKLKALKKSKKKTPSKKDTMSKNKTSSGIETSTKNEKGLKNETAVKKAIDALEEDKCSHNKVRESCFFCSTKNETVDKSHKLNVGEKRENVTFQDLKTKEKDKSNTLKEKLLSKAVSVNGSSNGDESFIPTQKNHRVAHDAKKTVSKEVSRNEKSNVMPESKARVAHTVRESKCSPKDEVKSTSSKNKDFYKSKENDRTKKSPVHKVSSSSGHVFTYGGIAVSHPKLSSSVLDNRLSGRKIINISRIESKLRNNDIEGDWITIGVLVKKVVQKKAANGKTFSVWHLSDLGVGTENQTVSFFLFGDTYKQHWKIQVGTVIGLLNPTIMKQEKSIYQELSITLDNPKKLMEIGVSKELGVCKGIRKNDGKTCSMFVNTRYGEYCEYHVQKAFKKARAGRMELQSGGAGPSEKERGNRMKMIKKDIDTGDVFYGGQTLSLQKNHKKDNVKLKNGNKVCKGGLLSVMGNEMKVYAAKEIEENKIKIKKEKENETQKMLLGGSEEFKQLLVTPTVGSRNLMQMLHGNQVKEEEASAPKKSHLGAADFLKQNKKELLQDESSESKSKKRKLRDIDIFSDDKKNTELLVKKNSNSTKYKKNNEPKRIPSMPKLGRVFGKSSVLEFSSDEEDHLSYNNYTGEDIGHSVTKLKCPNEDLLNQSQAKQKIPKFSDSSIKAKRKAISIIQQKGSIKPEDPNEIPRKKKSTLKEIEDKVEKSQDSDVTNIEKKREGTLKGVLGNLDINSEEGKRIMKQNSRNVGAIRLAEAEQEDKYFNSLEKKERMEEKMSSVYELKITCYACKVCKYLAPSQSQLCRDEKHEIAKVPHCTKRFFKCKSCQFRCETYNEKYPTAKCRKCGVLNYEKTSMTAEKKGPKIAGETLELRGREEKFLNSMF